uniref:CvpA family protein n=1 Tax=Ammonifex degensii TaxID=42838 RepID=A0A7C2E2J5_9THEO
MNWLDVILILLLAGGCYQGLRTGLVLSFIRLAGIGVAFLVATRYHQLLGVFLEQHWHLTDLLAAWLANFYKHPEAFWGGHPEAVRALVPGRDSGPIGVVQAVAALSGGGAGVWRAPVALVAHSVINAAAFLLLFIGTERLWFFIGRYATFFRRWLPFLPLDRLGGAVFGAGWGVVGGVVLVLLLRYVVGLGGVLMGTDNFLARALNTAALVPYYEGLFRAASGFFSGAGVAV